MAIRRLIVYVMNLFQKFQDKIYSGDNMLRFSEIRYLPRWIVLFIDFFILIFATFLSFQVMSAMGAVRDNPLSLLYKFALIISINIGFMLVFRTFAGVMRHSSFVDLFKLFLASICTALTLILINGVCILINGKIFVQNPLLFLYFAFSFSALFLVRIFVKEAFHFLKDLRLKIKRKKILILGIGDESIAMARAVMTDSSVPYEVVGFVTERADSNHASILGRKIYTKDKFVQYIKKVEDIDGILMISKLLTKEELEHWTNLCLENGLQVLNAPSVMNLENSTDLKKNIKSLEIEDLLNRTPIKLDDDEVQVRHHDKSVLITGGAGSIGSEIVRQVAQFTPSLIVVFDQAETPLYDLELEMAELAPNVKFRFVLGDISNQRRLEDIFKKYQFSMVYHAAAYKHVPMIENNPREAVLVNVLGTKIVANLSMKYKVNRFVMVSTDKAVNPTNVMGASKRVAELYVQSLQDTPGNTTKFITTRFGNVLGSNGSVIPHFKSQIEKGGPITVTHPEIVRYFMTIPEACQLVLQAGTMGKGGEIFVFDMGEPVKIVDLATRMIQLSGLEPGKDIKIIYTGLRPGEKLYEELLSNNTENLATPHRKIMISMDEHMVFEEVNAMTLHVIKAALRSDKIEVVRQLKNIVPEFISNNSMFESLDE